MAVTAAFSVSPVSAPASSTWAVASGSSAVGSSGRSRAGSSVSSRVTSGSNGPVCSRTVAIARRPAETQAVASATHSRAPSSAWKSFGANSNARSSRAEACSASRSPR